VKRFSCLISCCALYGVLTAPAMALPCAADSLSDYVVLGAGGCTVGTLTFSDFSIEAFPGGATDLDPLSIVLTPVANGLAVSTATPVAAGPGDFFGLRFLFLVSDPDGLTGGTIALGESSVEEDGVNTALLDAGLMGNAIAFDIGLLADPVESFSGGPSSFFDVFVELAIDGGLNGSASLGPTLGTITFQVPEPPTALLLALALFGITRRTRS